MDNNYNEELLHYGVKGMRWGVRRATKRLTSANSTDEAKAKAVSTLQKHRAKATKKIAKLESKHDKLASNAEKHIMKTDVKAQKMKSKAAKYERKAYRRFTSTSKAAKLAMKANRLNAKADTMIAKSESAKAKLAKNETMTRAFKEGVSNIDQALVSKGRKYINAKPGRNSKWR